MDLQIYVLSEYTRVTDDRQMTDDRRHLTALAELAMQSQRSAKNVRKK